MFSSFFYAVAARLLGNSYTARALSLGISGKNIKLGINVLTLFVLVYPGTDPYFPALGGKYSETHEENTRPWKVAPVIQRQNT